VLPYQVVAYLEGDVGCSSLESVASVVLVAPARLPRAAVERAVGARCRRVAAATWKREGSDVIRRGLEVARPL
jgi:hypothetical protein